MNERGIMHFCTMQPICKRIIFLLTISVNGLLSLHAQSSYIPLGSGSFHMLDRLEIKSGKLAVPSEFNTSTRSYKRSSIASYVDSFDVSHTILSKQDYFNLDYLQNDNFEWSNSESTKSLFGFPLIKLYKHKAALYDHVSPDFNIVVNPLANIQFGYDSRLKEVVSLNNRGIEIRGSIKNTVGFYTQFSDEINHTSSWVRDYFQNNGVIPGAGFLKTIDHKTFNYGLASGYISLQAGKYVDLQFGHGRNFIGNGYRSFYMSDFSRDHLYLRVNTRIWKINYTNIWGMMYDYTPMTEAVLPKRHYYATTHASVNLTKNFNLGLFQTISYQRDSGYTSGGPEMEYFNPVIFYKPIENGLNSPDKAILGTDFKYNFLKHFSLYGQFVISEFVMSEVLAGNGWFGNKQAYQLGIKYIDVFTIRNLDLQVEYNQANPYMYTSFSRLNAYVNYNQNMAHPIGANFRELVSVLRYQPVNRLFLKGTAIISTYGNDTNGSNWGKNIALSYHLHPREYGNFIGQGIKTNLYIFDLTASYMIKHNLFIELQVVYRKTGSALDIFNTETLLTSIGLRWNLSERRWDF